MSKSKSAGSQTAIIAFAAFIGLGLTSGLLGLAWPYMQKSFNLPLDGVNTLLLLQTVAYTLAGFYIGRTMARLGSGTALLVGAVLMSLCMFGIAVSATWLMVVAISVLFGLGSGMIDAGLNMYVAAYHTAQQMSWLHASFGIGITIGPLIMTYVVTHGLGWQAGYAVVGVLLLMVVLLLAFTRHQWRSEGFQSHENTPVRRASFAETVRVPSIWLGMATFVIYVGLELGLGQWAFTILTESRGIQPEVAGLWVSFYWAALTLGRIGYGLIANRFDTMRVLRFCMLGILCGTSLFWLNPLGVGSLLGLIVIGVSQAPVFPLLMSGTVQRVGAQHAENSISMQMGAVGIGGALLPGLLGTIGKVFGIETMAATFVIMAVLVLALHELTRVRRVEPAALASVGD